MTAREQVDEVLKELNIPYQVIEHEAVYTIEEMEKAGITEKAVIPKNVFVRDARGKRHLLIVLRNDKQVDMASLSEKLRTTRLSFASEERLNKYLGLIPGAVSPLGIINDKHADVEVVMDRDLIGEEHLGVHPCENTATYVMAYRDIEHIIKKNGNDITVISI